MSDFARFSRLHRLDLKAGEWKFTERPGGWIIAEGPRGERRRFQAIEVRKQLSFHAAGRSFAAEITQSTAGAGGGAAVDVEAELISQFPGKVRKVLVAEGDSVEAGQSMLLIEAMKMEFAIKAPVAGKVVKLLVKEGQQLSPGDRFLDFEAAAGPAKTQGGKSG